MYKALNGKAPIYSSDLLVQYKPQRSLRSADEEYLVVPKTKMHTAGDRAFSVHAPRLWNRLPKDIRTSKTITTFKSKLKTYLFKSVFD